MIPRSAAARSWACLAYLPPVAVGLLLLPEFREIKLVRQHSLQSLALAGLAIAGSLALAWVSAILGALPLVGYWLLALAGILISLWMLLLLGLAIAGALAAYQGRYLRIAGVSRLVRAAEQRLGPARAPDPLQWEHEEPARPRRPRGRPD